MKKRILIAYASKHGSTEEIAEAIGNQLRSGNVEVDVRPAKSIKSLEGYDACIVGSAVYIGQWRKEAVQLLKRNTESLAKMKVWVFSTGPTGAGDPEELLKGWQYPEALKPVLDKIDPVDITVFHGSLDENKLNGLEKIAIKMVKAPVGDFRDWGAVTSWAEGISFELQNATR
jgi:menaquinone-dependent protoporphyrinogen oxidase